MIETPRLTIRPFLPQDLDDIHRILDQAFGDGSQVDDPAARSERRSWLEWSSLNQVWFPALHQPPYGERAVALRDGGQVIGAVGFVPCLDAFEQIPELRSGSAGNCSAGNCSAGNCYNTPEFGLFWAIDPAFQRQGYATEAARALVDFAFGELRLKRIIATTEFDNHASQAVMRKLGMWIAHNPLPTPPWLQVVGILKNPLAGS